MEVMAGGGSCDTMVALGPHSAERGTLFAKNSDRAPNEAQEVVCVPRLRYEGAAIGWVFPAPGRRRQTRYCWNRGHAYANGGRRHEAGASVRCTYIEVPQAPVTHAVLLCKVCTRRRSWRVSGEDRSCFVVVVRCSQHGCGAPRWA